MLRELQRRNPTLRIWWFFPLTIPAYCCGQYAAISAMGPMAPLAFVNMFCELCVWLALKPEPATEEQRKKASAEIDAMFFGALVVVLA